MKLITVSGILALLLAASCSSGNQQKPVSENQTSANNTSTATDVAALYVSKCVVCHGNDGKAGIGGAFDLSASVLDKAGAASVITNGRKAMRAYKDELTPAEIDSLAAYLQTLKK
jgi:cytochrome c6